MKLTSLFAVDVIECLVKKEPDTMKPQGPAGRIGGEGALHDQYDGGDGVDEEADDCEGIGCPCGRDDFED